MRHVEGEECPADQVPGFVDALIQAPAVRIEDGLAPDCPILPHRFIIRKADRR